MAANDNKDVRRTPAMPLEPETLPLHMGISAAMRAVERATSECWLLVSHETLQSHLTFDMRGDQPAQPVGHPLDGMVGRHRDSSRDSNSMLVGNAVGALDSPRILDR